MDPIVLENGSLPQFVKYVINSHSSPSLLIICSSRDAFIQRLLHALTLKPRPQIPNADAERESTTDDNQLPQESAAELLSPTLHLLATTRTLKVIFCDSLQVLLAYLSPHGHTRTADGQSPPTAAKEITFPMLAILNPLSIHRNTSSWSAQGLGKMFASAVEAASRAGQKLVMFEDGGGGEHAMSGEESDHRKPTFAHEDAAMDIEVHAHVEHSIAHTSAWKEQVAILNVTTKSFGVREKGWVGRTVRVRKVAERWCRFVDHV